MVQRIQVQTEDNMADITNESTVEELVEKAKLAFLLSKDETTAEYIEEHKKFQEIVDAE